MTKRLPISTRTRFDVFKRDGFVCQYCGAKPPTVILELDHVHPVSKGGTNDPDNLLTSCEGCNRGKSNGLLDKVIPSAAEKAERIAEAEAQLKEYQKALKARRRREDRDIDAVQAAFQERWGDRYFTETFRDSARRNFLAKLPVVDMVSFMRLACERVDDPNRAIKYFCGICWNNIRGGGNA